jgi:hypothetical protein
VELQTALGLSHSANMLEFDAAFACLSGQFDDAVRIFVASRSAARRSGTPWPFTAFSVQLLDRARAALDSSAFDVAWRAGQLDPQRLYLERFGAEWAAGGGNR